jgi:hypothetical protein
MSWLLAEVHAQLGEFGPQELALCAWALARLGVTPPPAWQAAFLEAAAGKLPAFEMRELSMLAGAVARGGYGGGAVVARGDGAWGAWGARLAEEISARVGGAAAAAGAAAGFAVWGSAQLSDSSAQSSHMHARARALGGPAAARALGHRELLSTLRALALLDAQRADGGRGGMPENHGRGSCGGSGNKLLTSAAGAAALGLLLPDLGPRGQAARTVPRRATRSTALHKRV